MSKVKVGEVYNLNEGGSATVIEYEHSDRVLIRHNDKYGYEQMVQAGHLKRGTVKNPYYPSVCGVGYMGVGRHKISKGIKHFLVYKKWRGMLVRCYCEKYQTKKPSYLGCTVQEEWHNFQVFAEWFYNNFNGSNNCELDKDLLVIGNKVYSSETCVLIPREINMFAKRFKKDNGLPVGVGKNGKSYSARIYEEGESKWLGTYENIESALKVYTEAKNRVARNLAFKWKNEISFEAYQALLYWDEYENSKFIFDGDSKIAKPDTFSEPNLKPFLGDK